MARTITAQEVLDQARLMVDDQDEALATDTEGLALVAKANARYHSYRVTAEPDAYRAEQTITSDDGTVPSDYYATVGVDYPAAGSRPFELSRLQEWERNDFVTGGSFAVKYAVRKTEDGTDDAVYLFPTPPASQEYTHIYLRRAPRTMSPSTTIDVRTGHEEYLVLWVARALKQIDEAYSGEFDADIEKYEKELKEETNLRYLTEMVKMATDRRDQCLAIPGYPFRRGY